jgi:hypothetical protein
MGKATEDDVFSCADARRALLRVMREERAVSEVIGRLVSPWEDSLALDVHLFDHRIPGRGANEA